MSTFIKNAAVFAFVYFFSYRYLPVPTGTYRYLPVPTGTYRYLPVPTGTYRYLSIIIKQNLSR